MRRRVITSTAHRSQRTNVEIGQKFSHVAICTRSHMATACRRGARSAYFM
jgi:hypothetical protein